MFQRDTSVRHALNRQVEEGFTASSKTAKQWHGTLICSQKMHHSVAKIGGSLPRSCNSRGKVFLQETFETRPEKESEKWLLQSKLFLLHCDGQLSMTVNRGGSSVGRALRSQCRGRGFDSPPLHFKSLVRKYCGQGFFAWILGVFSRSCS